MSASTSAVLWSCARRSGDQLDEEHEVERGDLVDDRRGRHRAIEMEIGVVSPIAAPAASSCRRKLPASSPSNRLITSGIGVAASIAAAVVAERSHLGQLGAELLLAAR